MTNHLAQGGKNVMSLAVACRLRKNLPMAHNVETSRSVLSTLLGAAPDHPMARLAVDKDAVTDIVSRNLLSHGAGDAKFLEDELSDALFWERKRLESPSEPVRDAVDQAFWRMVSKELPASAGDESALSLLMERVIRYHMAEVSGHFNPFTYKIATTLVPRGFYWLLQAASWKSVAKTFQERMDLRGRVNIQGHTDQLRYLSKKGTVLLVPTHFSNLDSLLMGWSLFEIGLPPFCYGAGLNLFSNPILAYFMNNLGAYKVDRKKKHRLYLDVLKEYSTTIIQRGCHSLFFPGGGRSRSGGLEKRIKMGLLGTGLNAYIRNLISGAPNPNIYVVPCVISYHSVLEASGLVGDFLAEQGKSRYLPIDEDSINWKSLMPFLVKVISTSTKMYMNFGQAMDPFGHLVDDEGRSLTDRGHVVDPVDFVKSGGEVKAVKQRDEEYTRILAERLVKRYEVENITLTSHFIAYAAFTYLRRKFPERDLFRLMRLTEDETRMPSAAFYTHADRLLQRLHGIYRLGHTQLEPALRSSEIKNVVDTGLRHLGVFHGNKPLKLSGDGQFFTSEDMKLLYYYHNRMAHHDMQRNEAGQ